MFRAITFLDLTIVLEKVSMPEINCEYPSRHLVIHQFLQVCFPPRPTELGNLQRLRLELGLMPAFFYVYKDQPDQLRRALDGNLNSIRNLHGLVEVSISIHFSFVIDQVHGLKHPTAPLRPWKMEFMAILRAFSNDLEQLIST